MATARRTAYEDTSVPVVKSQGQIRDLLKAAGALGVEFGEDFERSAIQVRFRWRLDGGREINVRMSASPLQPEPNRDRYNRQLGTWKFSPDQRDRQAWRGLHWYLKAMIDAATFGLLAFEDVFLSFMESEPHGPTVGEVVMNQLERSGRLQITAAAELVTGDYA